MSEQDKSFIEAFKKQVINVAVLYAFALLISAIGFYYTTNNALSAAASERIDIKETTEILQAKIDLVNERKINKDDYIREITEMKELLRDLNRKVDKLK